MNTGTMWLHSGQNALGRPRYPLKGSGWPVSPLLSKLLYSSSWNELRTFIRSRGVNIAWGQTSKIFQLLRRTEMGGRRKKKWPWSTIVILIMSSLFLKRYWGSLRYCCCRHRHHRRRSPQGYVCLALGRFKQRGAKELSYNRGEERLAFLGCARF